MSLVKKNERHDNFQLSLVSQKPMSMRVTAAAAAITTPAAAGMTKNSMPTRIIEFYIRQTRTATLRARGG